MTNGEKFLDVFGFGADGSRVIAVNSTWWDCDFQIRKPKTNADRIRSMTDEELADELLEWYAVFSAVEWTKDMILEWLKREAE